MVGAKSNQENTAAAPTGSISSQILSEGRFSGIFAGWGASRVVALQALPESGHQVTSTVSVIGDTSNGENFERTDVKVKGKHAHGLSTLSSVSIAGSDIMSSCLYTAGICAYTSGKLAPLALLSVTIMLFFFRRVYSETVSAMPVNGGTYNLMLNTTNKKWAAFVACLSILSYMATAIISAYDAVVYLKLLWPDVDMRLFTCVIILVFAVVALCGVGESAAVATPILLTHIAIVTLLIVWGFAYGIQDGFSIFYHNTQTEYPTIINSSGHTLAHRSGIGAMYFGYCSGLLGITGFESAANFVEEMKSSKVFVETVNWMWGLVGFYNPMISFVAMMVLPLDTIYEHSGDMLAIMADKLGGERFRAAVCVDATIILCGAVLTSFIGIAGLLRRLAADSILPQALAIEDSRGTPSVAIIVFLVLSLSLFLAIYDPSNEHAIEDFGGVYAIAFLSVLVCFAMAAVMLKLYRPYLARRVIAKWWQVFCSLICVSLGFLGNIILAPKVFYLFLAYLSGFIGVVALMFGRVEVLSIAIWMLRRILMTGKSKTVDPNSQEDRIIPAVYVQELYSETDALLQGDEMDEAMYMLSSPDGPIATATTAVIVGTGVGGNQKNGDYSMLQTSSSRRQSKNSDNLDLEADIGAVVPGLDAPNPNGESWKDSTRSDDPAYPSNEIEMTAMGDDTSNNANVPRSDSNSNRINARQNRASFTQSTTHIFSWAENVVEQVRTRRRKGSITSVGSAAEAESSRKKTQRRRESTFRTEQRTYRSNSVVEMDRIIMRRSLTSRVLNYCMKRLDDIVSEPFVYLCKGPDPVAVHLALEYVTNNEVTNQIYVVHFVDDRQAMQMNNRVVNAYKTAGKRHPRPSDPAVSTEHDDNEEVMVKHQQKGTALMLRMFTEKHPEAGHDEKGGEEGFDLDHALRMMPSKAKQLMHLVHIIDTFYTYKKITCVVVRGMFFCPRAVQAALKYMKCSSNNMIMGVPDTTFPFQPAQLGGVRIVVPDSNPTLRRHTYHHLREALRESLDLYTPHNRRPSINPRRNSADLDAAADEDGEEYDPGMYHHPHDMFNDGDLHSDDEYENAHDNEHHPAGGAQQDVEGQLFPHWDYHPDHPTEYPKPPTAAEEKAAVDAQAKIDANSRSPNASSPTIVAPRANSNANFVSAVRGISSAMFDL